MGLRDLGGYDHQMGTPIKSSKYFDHITGSSQNHIGRTAFRSASWNTCTSEYQKHAQVNIKSMQHVLKMKFISMAVLVILLLDHKEELQSSNHENKYESTIPQYKYHRTSGVTQEKYVAFRNCMLLSEVAGY
uniref:Uncharacterized protein n=1 Tax=Arundo donax TaxID=35708 RepID=A0A0A9EW22_ARUDO